MAKKIWPAGTQLGPLPVVLIGSGNGKEFKNNLFTVAWTGIVCSDPAMLSISVRKERFSYQAIAGTGEFTVNVPGVQLAPAVDWCGVVSGRDHDKFSERHLTALPGSQVAAPVVAECPINLECRVKQMLELGSHDLFIAEILAVQVSEEYLDEKGAFDPGCHGGLLGYVHGHYYNMGSAIGHFGYSVRKKPGPAVRVKSRIDR